MRILYSSLILIMAIGCGSNHTLKQKSSLKERYIYTIQTHSNRFKDAAIPSYEIKDEVENLYRELPNTVTIVTQPKNRTPAEIVYYYYPYLGAIRSITRVSDTGTIINNANAGNGLIAGGDASAESGVCYEVVVDKNPIWNEAD